MVLCCYKAAVGDGVYAWVLTMVPYLWKSEGSGSEGGEREKRGERKRGGREVEVGVEKGCDNIHISPQDKRASNKSSIVGVCFKFVHNDVIMTSDDAIAAHFILKVWAPIALDWK